MINIVGGRASGKTIKLIDYANMLHSLCNNVVVIVARKDFAQDFYSRGLNEDIPVMTASEYLNKGKDSIGHDPYVLIDDSKYVIEGLFRTRHLITTMDSQYLKQVKRSDWDKNYKEN